MVESVPLVHLSKAYSSAIYNKIDEVIHFKVASHTTSITKRHFTRLLGIASSTNLLDPESISSTALIEMFYQMGYTRDIALLSKFRNPFLPPMWNGLFTLLFKSFFERVTGSYNASKLFYTLIYGLYHGIWIMVLFNGLNSSKAQSPPLATQRYLVLIFGP